MPIAPNTLFDEAKCYLCLGITQAEALELALLNRIASGTGGGTGGAFYFLNFYGGWPAGVMANSQSLYFFGNNPFDVRTQIYGYSSIKLPTAGTITEFYVKAFYNTAGTAENATHSVRINNTTDVGPIIFNYSSVGLTAEGSTTLSTAVVANDEVAMKVATPAWVTAPVGVRYYMRIKITV